MYHVVTLADGTTWAFRSAERAAPLAAKPGATVKVWADADYLREYGAKLAGVLPPALAAAIARRALPRA